MSGVIFNTFTVLLGSSIGLIFKKGIGEKYSDAIMKAIGLCTLLIGIGGMNEGGNVLVTIVSAVLGVILGTAADIDGLLSRLGDKLSKSPKKDGKEKASLTEGFVTASLLFCVGAMTIVGSLESGLNGDNTTIFTKSILDLFSSMMLSASLGFGVMLSVIFVLVFQGGLVLLAGVLEPLLSTAAVAEITCMGSVMIFALGLNLLGITKIKVANFFPCLILTPFVLLFFDFINGYLHIF